MRNSRYPVVLVTLAAAVSALPPTVAARGAGGGLPRNVVYTMSNSPAGNAILAFEQGASGALAPAGSFPTAGAGTGGGLGNQGALVHDGEYLVAVNAGSNDLSVLRFGDAGLELTDVEPSGGIRPVSVTIDRGIVYVVNAGSDSIAGFRLDGDGDLTPLPGSVQPLSGSGTGPAQIQFSDDGQALVVTEKATNLVVTFALDRSGVPAGRHLFASPGATPFGFAFGPGRRLFVSEAAGGAANASSVTSWRIEPDGGLQVVTPAAPTLQSAACWVILTPDGRFAYTTNTASGTISAFRVRGGDLDLLDGGITGVTGPGTGPIDVAITAGGRYLHVLNAGDDTLATFRIERDGGLTYLASLPGLPDGANGLAAR